MFTFIAPPKLRTVCFEHLVTDANQHENHFVILIEYYIHIVLLTLCNASEYKWFFETYTQKY